MKPPDSAKRVLIIDDEAIIRHTLADFLSECGYQTATAADGVQGIELAQNEPFDIVLVDLRMPRLNGMEVIATLRQSHPNLPLVVISGAGVLQDAIKAIRRGAWDYITKPIADLQEILIVIDRALEKARLRVERDRYQRELEQLNRSLDAQIARQTADLRQQNRELIALNRIANDINSLDDLDLMLQQVLDTTVDTLQADGGVIRLYDPHRQHLTIAATSHLDPSILPIPAVVPTSEGPVGQVVQDGQPWVWHADESSAACRSRNFASGMIVPLRSGDQTVGTLCVATRERRDFSPREINLVTSISNQLGVAIARARYAAEIEQANTELRRLDTLREQFIQNVAHELRTPLALVRGYVDMLHQEDLNAQERKMAIKIVSQRVEALVELVDAITTLQELDSQPLRAETIAPRELVETAVQMVRQRANRTRITIDMHCPPDTPPLIGDFERLAQALHQLLDNACKFSPPESVVSVNVQLTDETLNISISDQGIGIPHEEQERIFERFYQIDGSTTRRYGGTGLGLAVAKEIIQAHGGHITLKSTVGQGSTFTVHLPINSSFPSPPPGTVIIL